MEVALAPRFVPVEVEMETQTIFTRTVHIANVSNKILSIKKVILDIDENGAKI